jgi:hypothetical protein
MQIILVFTGPRNNVIVSSDTDITIAVVLDFNRTGSWNAVARNVRCIRWNTCEDGRLCVRHSYGLLIGD